MCGRYVLHHSAQQVQARFGLSTIMTALTPRYNAAPTQQLPVIVQHDATVQLEWMRWGLVPSWAKEINPNISTFNARAEGISEKPMYRGPIRRQRCLVPADGFFEWHAAGKGKQPYFIHRADDALFAFAGLYDRYRQPDGTDLWSYTIITTEPNAEIAPLHHRMAVILRPEDEAEWLDPDVTDPLQVTRLLRPYPDGALAVHPVSTRVNNARLDEAAMIAPLDLA
ncbi:MAG: SOS response-associated peptidase [Ktedonobacterales bacterium]|nr:SOS response-associated peptidase [Ktedonobacterales bacterium]